MCSGKIFKELKDEPIHVKMVSIVLDLRANLRPTTWKGIPIGRGEVITSWGHLAKQASTTVKLVRSALKRLIELDIIKVSSEDRRFTRILVLSMGSDLGSDSGSVSGSTKTTKKRIESKKTGSDLGSVSGSDSGDSSSGVVSAVRRSSPAFDVSPSGVLNKDNVSLSARKPTDPSSLEKFKDDFNRYCPRLIACRSLTDKRRKKMRLEIGAFPDPLYWDEVFRVANKSAFMAGDNDRRWKANFDFILRCHVEIVEGKYSKPAAFSASMPRELVTAKKVEEQRDLSRAEVIEMHRDTVATVYRGVCRTKDCQLCEPAVAVAAELEELPV